MKQKKRTEAEKNTAENKRKTLPGLLLPELFCMILAGCGSYGICYLRQQAPQHAMQCTVMTVMGMAILGFRIRREYLSGSIPAYNREHLIRFWICFIMAFLLSLVCVFLPVEGWPFLAVFVILSLYGSPVTGIIASVVLLMIPVMINGAPPQVFFLYLISGVFAVCLFCPMENDVKIGIPLFLSILCLLTCETAGLILPANARPSMEMFVVPAVNLVISTVLLLGCVKLFSTQVVYQYRIRYLELNDTENPVLAEYRQTSKESYMKCIHIAYFCERIGGRLSLDVDALKCAAYYHGKGQELFPLMEEKRFPPKTRSILKEYLAHKESERKNPIRQKETAVLFCTDTVVTSILQLIAKDKEKRLDYDKLIDKIFQCMLDAGTLDFCDIAMRELRTMQKIFKEEKLYYDFLR